jgi:mannose-6-phosphate isomerase-like protein (cupin superfamily)
MSTAVQPRHVAAGAGTSFRLGRITLTFKTTGPDSRGAYTLCEAIEPPGSGAGLHRHATYDEMHIVCEGRYQCRLGDHELELGPGEMMFAPRGTAHSIKSVGPDTGRELIISSPGGVFEAFIAEVAGPADETTGTFSQGAAKDFRAIAAKYGIEFLD